MLSPYYNLIVISPLNLVVYKYGIHNLTFFFNIQSLVYDSNLILKLCSKMNLEESE